MKKKFLIYLLSGIIPLTIFLLCTIVNDLLPFGKSLLNIYDSFTQYSGISLEFKNLLHHGNIFYSWNAGLGFNFLGAFFYYMASPLNLLCLLADTKNYPYFISIMTLLRIVLLGLSMCFYLTKRGTKPIYIVIFSTIYALMGFTATYYYNFLWIDSIIMLPLVIHGLDNLIEEKQPTFYIFSLTLTIYINFYIGYMICAFSLIYFIYRIILLDNKKGKIKTFITSSLLAGLMSSFVILPTFFALSTGKIDLYQNMNYSGLSRNGLTLFHSLMSGQYQWGDQIKGPAQIYSSILVVVLNIMYFFNDKFTKKEKITTFCVLLFFYLSLTINALNYAWQMFQSPIWWNSRFSFVISFFLIIISLKSLENIDKVNLKNSKRIIISMIFIVLILVGFYFKQKDPYTTKTEIYTYIFLVFSIFMFFEFLFIVDKKYFFTLVVFTTLLDVSINTYNSLKQNNRGNYVYYKQTLKEELPKYIDKLNKENKYEFYRMEIINNYTSDDGLYFNYHGIRYFNSVRNNNVLNMLLKLGVSVKDKCFISFKEFDPVFLSLFNVKYLLGKVPYFIERENDLNENPYPLSLGYIVDSDIKNLTFKNKKDTTGNLNKLVSTMLGKNVNLYKRIDYKNFTYDDKIELKDGNYNLKKGNEYGLVTYTFNSDKEYLIIPGKLTSEITINNEYKTKDDVYIKIQKGDKVKVSYKIYIKTSNNKVYLNLLDMDEYRACMKALSNDLMHAKTYKNGHILEGKITVSDDNGYLFTSIEHEEGMRVYLDGLEIKPDIILDSLIGFDISKGKHTIKIDYIPKGLKVGLTISILSLLITVFYLQKHKKSL